MFSKPLRRTKHHLLFTIDDHTVDLDSMLDERAQGPASEIHGYDNGHEDVMRAPLVHAKVFQILDAAEAEHAAAQEQKSQSPESAGGD